MGRWERESREKEERKGRRWKYWCSRERRMAWNLLEFLVASREGSISENGRSWLLLLWLAQSHLLLTETQNRKRGLSLSPLLILSRSLSLSSLLLALFLPLFVLYAIWLARFWVLKKKWFFVLGEVFQENSFIFLEWKKRVFCLYRK